MDLKPTDRSKSRTKRHLVVGKCGTPFGVTLSGANRHNSMMLVATLAAIFNVRRKGSGRPWRRPDRLNADEGYDHRRRRKECSMPSVNPCIARRGVENNQYPGRHH